MSDPIGLITPLAHRDQIMVIAESHLDGSVDFTMKAVRVTPPTFVGGHPLQQGMPPLHAFAILAQFLSESLMEILAASTKPEADSPAPEVQKPS